MAAIDVDIGIGECINALDSIATRRQNRKENEVANLCDDLDAVSEIVKMLDNLFINLVIGFKTQNITSNQAALYAHMEQTMKYLSRRDLLPKLLVLLGNFKTVIKRPSFVKSEELRIALENFIDLLNRYRERLGYNSITGVGQTQDWNLMTLWEKAQGYHTDIDLAALADMADQVHKNQNFRLSDSIHECAGRIRGLARNQLA